ncbi:MFS transporter [Clostridium sp. HMP27]|uniref:MFS transporter n=1 Tax=Clostridium sp. HMP27 TaxID=1487921 RepID=UPI00052B6721|nr:MFS transporter [Clostridium sp. HMP27]KGK84248.1 multidrug MFS transporter [Clostridium sp. HMP27]
MENTKDNIYKNRWLILLIVVMQPFMACLDGSIVNVALPVMARRLSVTMSSIEWVVTSYLIVISATILVFGRLGDIKGKTTVFKWGLVLFAIGSLLCGISSTLTMLVVSRVVQAIGASATMATNQGIITHVFPAEERGRALGISGTFVALGTLVGPPLGGFIVSVASWQYIFLINVPIGILIFIFGMKFLPKSNDGVNEKLDIKGAFLFLVAIVSLFMCVTKGQEIGYNNFMIILGFVLAIVSFSAFIILEKRTESPLLQLDIFKNKLFSISVFCAFISFAAISCINIIQPFYLQEVIKLSPSSTGLFMMVYPLILTVVAPISGYLSDKIGSEFLTFLGISFTAVGLIFMSTLNEYSTIGVMMIFVSILSLGNGLFQSPNTSLVMSTVPKHKLGIAGSVNALVRNVGMVFGVSFSTTLLYNRMSYKIGYKVSSFVQGREDVFIYGMRIVYISAAIICVIGALTTALRLYQKRRSKKELSKVA